MWDDRKNFVRPKMVLKVVLKVYNNYKYIRVNRYFKCTLSHTKLL